MSIGQSDQAEWELKIHLRLAERAKITTGELQMGTTVQSTRATFDEFVKLPDPPTGHLELHHGEIVPMPPRKHRQAEIQQALWELLQPSARGNGFLTIEFPFRAPGHEAWQADVGFVRAERQAEISDYLMGAPDLVIEVLSPSNTMDEMNDKMEMCLSNGCVSFWVVDPKRKLVSVTQGDICKLYRESAAIPLPAPLEGTIAVSDIFRAAI